VTQFRDVQGNVVSGYGSAHARFVFARITERDLAQEWIGSLINRITFSDDRVDEGGYTINLAITYAGLRALRVPQQRCRRLDAFKDGMARRASLLGDVGSSAPGVWRQGLRDTHLLLTITAWDADVLDERRAEWLRELIKPGNGLKFSYAQSAARLPGDREHFGFAGGHSQPAVAGADLGPREGEGTLSSRGRWRELATGEFILGYDDEGASKPPAPAGPLGESATFMVVRKLEQNAAAFRTYVAEQAARAGRDREWIAARMIGRWQNGSPLVSYPEAPGPDASSDPGAVNKFGYAGDPDGLACPLGAHVRRAFPRDGLGWQGRLTQGHRLIRRGISYGVPLPDGDPPDGHGRGLMFVCYCGSLERQFEFVQRQWLGDGNAFGLGDDRDPIAGGGPRGGGIAIQGHPPMFLANLPQFVITRGGDYFLLPGRPGLRALASGDW
jgi:Dyp-type peroxidase family